MNRNFEELHMANRDRVLHHIKRITQNVDEAEDVTSAAFASALKCFHQFRGQSSFYTWVTAIAMNELRGAWRRNKSVKLEPIDELCPGRFVEPDLFIQSLVRSECSQKIRQVLRRVPSIYRKVLTDHFITGHSIREIAQEESIPEGTVLSRIFKGKRILRTAWEA